MSFTKPLIRCQVFPSKTGETFKARTGSTPVAFRATGVRFTFTFFDEDSSILDVANVASVTLHAKTLNTPGDAPIILKTITSLNTTLTAEQYALGVDHAVIDFTAAEMSAFAAAGKFDLTLSGTTTDDVLDADVFGVSLLEIKDAGISNLITPSVGSSPAVTLEQLAGILGSYAKRLGEAGDTITLVSPDGLTQRILGIGNDGSRIDSVQQ